MKSKSLLIVAVLGIITLFVIPIYAKQQQQQEPKKYTCTLTDQQWQAVIGAIISPDDYSNNAKKQVSELIQKNLILADTTKAKK